jgi:release factor glutamine methyltransferase
VVVGLDDVTARLADAGFIAAPDEAAELLACSLGDDVVLESMIERRLRGEPLAWITGFAMFCGSKILVDAGVYVPRWQSEPLARRAAARLPDRGIAIDLCTGSGAIAKTLQLSRPHARIVASDLDDRAVQCASSNGVEVCLGDLFAPLPLGLEGTVDVVVGVVPYVPTDSLSLLPRDTFIFESTFSYDGGDDGADVLRRVVRDSARFLRPGGALLMELGGDQVEVLREDLTRHRFTDITTLIDDEGDVRGLEATLSRQPVAR